jgi:ferritin-like metal-binding protein YciE
MAKEPKQLDELFHDTLKDIYFAEKKILATLPKMSKAAKSEELKAAFEKHRGEPKVRLNGWSRCLQPSIKSLKAKPVRRSLV